MSKITKLNQYAKNCKAYIWIFVKYPYIVYIQALKNTSWHYQRLNKFIGKRHA